MKKKEEKLKTPWWFYIVLFIIPILFFVILELALRLMDYGDDYTQWVKITENKYVLNPDYTKKFFFSTASVPYSNGNVFDVEKKESAFRIFILGGSSAAGFPFTPGGDFGKYLQKRLEVLYPENKIEIVNAAITAVNSYTLRDLIEGVIEQKPDLIIIYAGHNEYYGALGAGSMESVGNSRSLVNLVIYLNKFKTTQLLRNLMKGAAGLFTSGEKDTKGGTLMARMARDQMIPYKSDVYNSGIEQFSDNMREVLEKTKEAGVPVILSTLVSNLKDRSPFISVPFNNLPEAETIYKEAQKKLSGGDYHRAESLFIYAKDLDALRFRASDELNRIIIKLGKEYNYPVTDILEGFNSISPSGITGDNIMTDHLHPDLKGYQLMGRMFFEEMEKEKLLPKGRRNNISTEVSDSFAVNNFSFTDLDSTIARYRIIILKNDWPFSEPKTGAQIGRMFNVSDYIDSLALQIVNSSMNWEESHRLAAQYYLGRGELELYLKEIFVLMDQFPFIQHHYRSAAELLLERQMYDLALEIVSKRYRYEPDAFTSKWIGIINLSRNKDVAAVKFLNESLNFNPSDPQVLFNLAGAYTMGFKYKEALSIIKRCLKVDPSFPGAVNLKQQLEAAVN